MKAHPEAEFDVYVSAEHERADLRWSLFDGQRKDVPRVKQGCGEKARGDIMSLRFINPTGEQPEYLRPLGLVPREQQKTVDAIRCLVRRDVFFAQVPNQSLFQRPHMVAHPFSTAENQESVGETLEGYCGSDIGADGGRRKVHVLRRTVNRIIVKRAHERCPGPFEETLV